MTPWLERAVRRACVFASFPALKTPIAALALLLIAGTLFALPAQPARAMDAYLIEPAYKDFPLQGPEKAKGLVIWNHGLFGTMTQYKYPPPLVIQGLAARGWDVVKLDRNPTYENGWTNAGQKHIARLVEEVEAAQKKGYARIILGGQSYGGAIVLEAARRIPVYAVIAMAPNSGQDVVNGAISASWSDAIASETYDEVRDLKTERAIFVLPTDDEFMRYVDRAPKVRELMAAKPMPFMLIDTQVHGHGGGYSRDFIPYAGCAMWFLDPAAKPKSGEFHCFHDEAAQALSAIGLNPKGASHVWFGYGAASGQEITVVQKVGTSGSVVDMGWGIGLFGKFKSGTNQQINATSANGTLSFLSGSAAVTLHVDDSPAKFIETRSDTSPPVLATLMPLQP
ncbi:MAG TPA: alpha/beta fold hydrolase [Magnetospirillaceae bacterium]|jgi:pimeloyl-ACP methyl ester carboxylesterase